MRHRVVIPCAGIGSRLEGLTKHVNKALVTLGEKPVISHVIEQFDPAIETVVALGYKGESVRRFLELAYPERSFIFVDIDNYDGPGSGLGYTLLKCKEHLQYPFIFIPNDTIVEETIPPPTEDWMGYAESKDIAQYRCIRVDGGRVTELCEKGAAGENLLPYIGLAGIHRYEKFWKAMENGEREEALRIGESHGLRTLIPDGVRGIRFTWHDTGNPAALLETRQRFGKGGNIERGSEITWKVGKRVIACSLTAEGVELRKVG